MNQSDFDVLFSKIREEVAPKDADDLARQIAGSMDINREISPYELAILVAEFAMRYSEAFVRRALEESLNLTQCD